MRPFSSFPQPPLVLRFSADLLRTSCLTLIGNLIDRRGGAVSDAVGVKRALLERMGVGYVSIAVG